MLRQFGLETYGIVRDFLVEHTGRLNWTTLLVALCESRQASNTLGSGEFHALVKRMLADSLQFVSVIEQFVRDIKNEGAKGRHCYCTRVCMKMQHATKVREGKLLLGQQQIIKRRKIVIG